MSGGYAVRSPAGLLLDWIAAAEIEEGPLIRPVYRGTALARHMAGFSISRLLKSIARRAGIDPETVVNISGHSLRVGAAQTLLGDGHDLLRLMKAGGWKSATTVLRYVDRTEIDVWMLASDRRRRFRTLRPAQGGTALRKVDIGTAPGITAPVPGAAG